MTHEQALAEAEVAFPEITVSEQELVNWMQVHQGVVAESLKSPHDAWRPQLMVMTKRRPHDKEWSGNIYVLDVPFNEAADKRAAMQRIGGDLYRQQLIPGAATMSTEAWASQKRGMEPRLDPDRREVVTVQGRTFIGRRTAWSTMAIGRDSNGMIVPGEFEPIVTEGVQTGLLDQLFRGFAEAGTEAILKKGLFRPSTH